MLVSQHRTCFRLNPAGSEGHERSPPLFQRLGESLAL